MRWHTGSEKCTSKQQTENMASADKLRQPPSFHTALGSPQSGPDHRASRSLRNSVSVSKLVARYQNLLDHESGTSTQENHKRMARNRLLHNEQDPLGAKAAVPEGPTSNVCRSRSSTTHHASPTPVNTRRRQTSSDASRVTPIPQLLPVSSDPLLTSSSSGRFRKTKTESSTQTTLQPLAKGAKRWTELPFSSPQSSRRRPQRSPATSTAGASATKEGKLSQKTESMTLTLPDPASDSATLRSYERTWTFLDGSDNSSHIPPQGQGRVKELTARYLSRTAAPAAHRGLAQPHTTKASIIRSPDSQKASKMAEAQSQKSAKVNGKKTEEGLPPPATQDTLQVSASPTGSQDPNPLPPPPTKESLSKFYQQRQVNELKRLYRHMHPELRKNLEEAVTEDLAEMLHTEDPNTQASVNQDTVAPSDVQSMRWIFENWTLDSIGDHEGTKKLADEETRSGDVKSTSMRFESQALNGDKSCASIKVAETGQAKGDVRTARWLFETQPLDSLNKLYTEEADVQEAVLKEPVQKGDVKGAAQLFETHSLDALGRCYSMEEQSILQLKSEMQEQKGDVKKTIKLFQTEPLCAIRDKTGNIHEIKSVCREEIQSNAVRTARWLFETQPLDTINKDTSKVQIIRGISLEEAGKPDVSGARWIFETQPLDAIRELTVEEEAFKASMDFVPGADVSKQRLLFETQALASLKGEASDSGPAKEEVVGGDVKSTLWLFETQPMETLKDNFEVGHLKKVNLSEEERGDVKQRKHIFETCPLGSISKASSEEVSATNVQEVVKGDVKSFKTLFETLPLDSIKQADAEPVTKEKEEIPAGNVKATQVLFETTPLYAIKDSLGNFHQITSVSREQVISGDVKNYKWMFETRPLDQFDESTKKVDIIRGITKQEVMAGDVKTAKWLFETQPMDVIHTQVNQGEEHSSVKREVSQKGDVKTCRWLFETQPIDTLYEKTEKKQEEDGSVPQANVKSYTWMFETQSLDSLKGQEEQYLQVSKAYCQDDLQGVDVKTVSHLFETEPLVSDASGEHDSKKPIRYSSRVEIQSGEVSRVKEFFETKPLDTADTPTAAVKKSDVPTAENIEAGSVHKFTWLFENCPMDAIKDNTEGIQEIPPEKDIKGGDVGGKRFVFETYSLNQIHDEVDETEIKRIQQETMSKASVKSYTMLFESQPLYAIQDKDGDYHEVTSVKKEEIMKGDVKGARWLFETKPLNQIKKEEEVFVIRAVTQEDIKKGDIQAARWRFETEPLDSFSRGKRPVVRTVDDVQKGDVQSNKQLFESQQVSQKKYVRMVSVSDVQQGDVRTSTWLFENQPIDSLKGEPDGSTISTVQREDSQKGDVKRCTWLFETQPMDSLKDSEVSARPDAPEAIPCADVKSTTWLFETTPLDKLSSTIHGEETEVRERTVRETLQTLCTCQAIQHGGILIEANDAESVRMAKYQLSSPGTPEIQKEETVKGNLQRIILQLLYQTKVEAQGVLVEEDKEGKIKVSPLQLLDPSKAHKSAEDLSDDVTKVLHDLPSQDISIKKGMVIQEMKTGSRKMTIYSLLHHSVQQEVVKGDVKSTIGNLLASSQEQRTAATIRREDNEKGNVQLYTSCIEKGDLDYLKTLQHKSEFESLVQSQAEQEPAEPIPRDTQGAKTHVLQEEERAEKAIADVVTGDVKRATKVLMCEGVSKEGTLEREATDAGAASSTVQCLGKPLSLPTVVEKKDTKRGELKVTIKSLRKSKDGSEKVEKEESVIEGAKVALQEEASAEAMAQKDEAAKASQCLVVGQPSQMTADGQEQALGSDLQAAMQSLRLATAEAKSIQHHVQSKLHKSSEEVHMASKQQAVNTQKKVTLQSTVRKQDCTATQQCQARSATTTTTTKVHKASKSQSSVSQKSMTSHKKVSASEEVRGEQQLSQESQVMPSADVSIKDGLYTAKPVKTYVNPFLESDYKEQAVQEEREQDVMIRGDVKTAIRALQSAAAEQRPVEKEDVVRGNLKATLQSLEKSNVNVSKGDFKAAMIYRNAGQSYTTCKKKNEAPAVSNEAAGVASGSQPDTDFPPPPPPPAAVMKTEHCPPSTKAPEAAPLPPASKDEGLEGPAPTHSSLPQTLAPISTQASNQSPPGKPETLPKPQITAPPRKKPVPPPKPERLLQEARSHHDSNSKGRLTKPVPPPRPPKPPGLGKLSRPPMDEAKGTCDAEVSEQSGCGEHPTKRCTPPSPVVSTAKAKDQTCETATPKGIAKTPLQIAEERYKASKEEQGKVESKHSKTSEPLKNEVSVSELEQTNEKAAVLQGIQGCTDTCSPENGCIFASKPGCLGGSQAALAHSEGQSKSNVSPNGQATLPRKGAASPKAENASVPNAYESWDNQSHIRKTNQKRAEGKSAFAHQQVTEQQQVNSRRPRPCEVETEQLAEEKPVVVMREKPGRETEDERRKRLSVHKEEIMKGNVKEAMEIFENLRRQEELQEILTRVREFEEETCKVDVKALRSFFEDVPEWVVRHKSRQPKQPPQHKAEKVEPAVKEDSDSVSSVELAFEDLERASAEIIHLKEQTLARLLDIEEAIRKALYSVSSLKSESDIAGLSGLFKESLGNAQSPATSNNIRKISIVSSKSRQEKTGQETSNAASAGSAKATEKTEVSKAELAVPSLVQPRVSSPSSPSYISIASAARKPAESPRAAHAAWDLPSPDVPDTQDKRDPFSLDRSSSLVHKSGGAGGCDLAPVENEQEPIQMKAGMSSIRQHSLGNPEHQSSSTSDKEKCSLDTSKGNCHGALKGGLSDFNPQAPLIVSSPQNPKRQKSILELQTGPNGSKLYGATRTVTEQYEEVDQFGNKIITSSTTVTKQAETQTSTMCDVVSPPHYEVTASPLLRRYLRSPGEEFHSNGSLQDPGVVFVTFGNSKPKK
ncbi:xin actin-binding repeat-containing protein 1 isoform X1 [Alligator mississippiensis]|uniref:xin actin-binding repeat-containing protein 1 isoform X1 n=2 Tax=Alligator mississippiensis TaxID=8496 RepID=UPI002877BD47|nr:xin actin-binding repeat-containing protein 1 isoform X1 [Alligator mississippiensis]